MFKKLLTGIILIGLVAGLAFFAIQMNNKTEKTIFNNGQAVGNTPSNLYNMGMVCENGNTIFFCNPKDQNRLYSMDTNGENLKKLSDDTACYINADENYVYYVRNNKSDSVDYDFFSFYKNALCRLPRNGGDVFVLDTEPCRSAVLIGNYIYYQRLDEEFGQYRMYKIKIDGTEGKKIIDEDYSICAADSTGFYFAASKGNGNIYKYDISLGYHESIYNDNCYQPTPIEQGNSFYYISGEKDNKLFKIDFTTGDKAKITSQSIDVFNVAEDRIYFNAYKEKEAGLYVANLDGSDARLLLKGAFCNIYVTEHYVFFTDFHSGDTFYFLKVTPDNIESFSPAKLK